MHMADALLAPSVAATMYVASGAVAGICVKALKKDEDMAKLPTMAVTAALVFAGQMINYTIPSTGSSGHLCGGMLLSALLGPQAGFLSMVVILAIQCLFFADGGLMALGANCWNMAFYGCFIGYYLIWKPLMHSRLFAGKKNAARVKIALSSVLGCIITLQMGAFSVVLETSASGVTELPVGTFVGIMQPIHLAIGLVEGLITAAVLLFIYEARPELLTELDEGTDIRQIRKQKTKVEKSLRSGAFEGLAPEPEEKEYEVIREKKFQLRPMTVDEAILQMNLLDHTFFMFKNADTGSVNVVYKRDEGNYAVLVPED